MERKYYNSASLERSLLLLERRWGISSHDFYELCINEERVEGMPRFTRSLWASLHRDFCRMRGDSFSVAVERALELA
jgi:hypothetical protein